MVSPMPAELPHLQATYGLGPHELQLILVLQRTNKTALYFRPLIYLLAQYCFTLTGSSFTRSQEKAFPGPARAMKSWDLRIFFPTSLSPPPLLPPPVASATAWQLLLLLPWIVEPS